MMTSSEAVFKLLRISERVVVNGRLYHIIPEEKFTPEEIEELREHDAAEVHFYGTHVYANFLPDDLRPSNVKKL